MALSTNQQSVLIAFLYITIDKLCDAQALRTKNSRRAVFDQRLDEKNKDKASGFGLQQYWHSPINYESSQSCLEDKNNRYEGAAEDNYQQTFIRENQ